MRCWLSYINKLAAFKDGNLLVGNLGIKEFKKHSFNAETGNQNLN